METAIKRPKLSKVAEEAQASDNRRAQISFTQRPDKAEVTPLRLDIGSVTLPLYEKMLARARDINADHNPLKSGVVTYTATVGTDKARSALLKVVAAEGFNTEGLFSHVTDGGSGAMKLMVRGCCEVGRPLMLIEPFYTNYAQFAKELSIPTTSIARRLQDDGKFTVPDLDELRTKIRETNAGALVVIPYDNPSGQFLPQEELVKIAKICVDEGVWMVSDEAYRGLVYTGEKMSSVWGITEEQVPGITGCRLSIESVSKVFNGCGERIGGIITDNEKLHQQIVKLATPSLCASARGQHALEALNELSPEIIMEWIDKLNAYYKNLISKTAQSFREKMPGLIVSDPASALYFVIDFRNVDPSMDTRKFGEFCAMKGRVEDILIDGKPSTLFLSPMGGFYSDPERGRTQMRVAAVQTEEKMLLAPDLCAKLFEQYKNSQQ